MNKRDSTPEEFVSNKFGLGKRRDLSFTAQFIQKSQSYKVKWSFLLNSEEEYKPGRLGTLRLEILQQDHRSMCDSKDDRT